MDFGLDYTTGSTSHQRRMTLGLDTALSSTSCDLSSSTSESEDALVMRPPLMTTPTSTMLINSNNPNSGNKGLDKSSHSSVSNSPTLNSPTSPPDFRSLSLLKERLGALWDKKLHTDVQFHVGASTEIVEAHKIILSSASNTFERLFYESTTQKADKFIIHEPDYSKAAFQLFIKAMYTNEIPEDLNLSLALEIFYASKKYQVIFLEEQILSHILHAVSIENVFEALKVSTSAIELTSIVPICWKIIEEKTAKVLSTHLEHLDEHNFTRILTRDHLNLEEVELFQFLVKWGSIQCKHRGLKTTGKNKRQMIDHMLKYIRFTTINGMDFNDIVIPSRILEPKEIFALQSHISPVNNFESKPAVPYNSRPRFKRVPLRRPESSTCSSTHTHSLYASSSAATLDRPGGGDTDIHVATPSKIKLRPKKSSRKLNVTKQSNGSKTYR